MDRFALVAQATRLLGLVLEHISNAPALDEEQAILLDKTLRALVKVVDVERSLKQLHMLNQGSICSM